MPGLNQVPVSLQEVIEVRGGGLSDDEIWSLILLLARRLKELVDNGAAPDTPAGFGPENIFLYSDGAVAINIADKADVDPQFLPAECKETGAAFQAPAVFVYCMGSVIMYALEFHPTDDSPTSPSQSRLALLSPELMSWINLMQVKHAGTRPTLAKLSQVSLHQLSVRNVDPSDQVHRMNVSILGTSEDLDVSDSDVSLSVGLTTVTTKKKSSDPSAIPESVLPAVTVAERVAAVETSVEESAGEQQDNQLSEGDTIRIERFVERTEEDIVVTKSYQLVNGHRVGQDHPDDDEDDSPTQPEENGHLNSTMLVGGAESRLQQQLEDVFSPIKPAEETPFTSAIATTNNHNNNNNNNIMYGDDKPSSSSSHSPRSSGETSAESSPRDQQAQAVSGANSNRVVLNPFDDDDDDRTQKQPAPQPPVADKKTSLDESNPFASVAGGETSKNTSADINDFNPFNDDSNSSNAAGQPQQTTGLPTVDLSTVAPAAHDWRTCRSLDCELCQKESPQKNSVVTESKTAEQLIADLDDIDVHHVDEQQTPPKDTTPKHKKPGYNPFGESFEDLRRMAEQKKMAAAERRSSPPPETGVLPHADMKHVPFEPDRRVSMDMNRSVTFSERPAEINLIEKLSPTSSQADSPVKPADPPVPAPRHAGASPVPVPRKKPPPPVPQPDDDYDVVEQQPKVMLASDDVTIRRNSQQRHSGSSQGSAHKRKDSLRVVSETSKLALQKQGSSASKRSSASKQAPPTSGQIEQIYPPVQQTPSMTSSTSPPTTPPIDYQLQPAQKPTAAHSMESVRVSAPVAPTAAAEANLSPVGNAATLPRRNSQRRMSKSLRNKSLGAPEFLITSRKPSIRLTAPTHNKRRKLLARTSDESNVHVVLLSGQRVDVRCGTDATASDVFELIVGHTNLKESSLFGLTVLKDGEHFFLEPDNKIYKFAPPGWRNAAKNLNVKSIFTLYLRLKFYPPAIENVKMPTTEHDIYLQLRRDIIDERLQTDRDVAYQLAAISMQAECSDRPVTFNARQYFHPDHHLPHRHLLLEYNTDDRIRTVLTELHSQYGGMPAQEAEQEYIRMCQAQREYGYHFHRIYRTKPSTNLGNTPLGDPDTGTPLWLGIQPKGIVVFEERRGERHDISKHPWHTTATLQFDRKRFIIVPQEGQPSTSGGTTVQHLTNAPVTVGKQQLPANALVFYTDDYKKSSYFVHFASEQHKYGLRVRRAALMAQSGDSSTLRLRQQQPGRQTLPSSVDSGAADLSMEASPDDKLNAQAQQATLERRRKLEARILQNSNAANQLSSGADLSKPNDGADGVLNVSVPSRNRTLNSTNNITTQDVSMLTDMLMDRLNSSDVVPSGGLTAGDFVSFTIQLVKDPQYGLGLTLVDGEIQGIKGVYVKSLTPGGPAELQGKLRVGDKLTAINGTDLSGRNRHDAVDLVRRSSAHVKMEAVRLKGLVSSSEESVAMAAGRDDSFLPASTQERPKKHYRAKTDIVSMNESAMPAFSSIDILNSTAPSSSSQQQQSRPLQKAARAKSDMSAVNKSSPLKLELDAIRIDPVNGRRQSRSRHSSGGSSHEDDAAEGAFAIPQTSGSTSWLNTTTATTSGMYKGLHDSSEDESVLDGRGGSRRVPPTTRFGTTPTTTTTSAPPPATHPANPPSRSAASSKVLTSSSSEDEEPMFEKAYSGDTPLDDRAAPLATHAYVQAASRPNRYRLESHGSEVDWADTVDMDEEHDEQIWDAQAQSHTVVLHKNDAGSLGLKIAGAGKNKRNIYVKALVGSPALDCDNIRPGDRLVSVNGRPTAGLSHAEVVGLLKTASSPVSLGLMRLDTDAAASQMLNSTNDDLQPAEMETISVRLDKPESGSFGLSLATVASGGGSGSTGPGVYVKTITPNSVAYDCGKLRLGDRLAKINGVDVLERSPNEVVNMLKLAVDYVDLELIRSNGYHLPELITEECHDV